MEVCVNRHPGGYRALYCMQCCYVILQMTIIQIAALKKVKKGTRVLLLDKNGGVAKDVAKGLNARGYKKVYVIDGGFNGWTSSKLQTRGSSSVR